MIWKTSMVLRLAVCVLSLPKDRHQRQDLSHIGLKKPEHHDGYAWSYPSYEFSYKVDDPDTHDKKGQHEHRSGDNVIGNYWLIQPDGEKRYIKYHVDGKSGFIAVVNYTSPHSRVYYDAIKKRSDTDKTESDNKEKQDKETQKDTLQEDRDRIEKEDEIGDNKSKQFEEEEQKNDGRENNKQKSQDWGKSHEERHDYEEKSRQLNNKNKGRNSDDKKQSRKSEKPDEEGFKNLDIDHDSPTDIFDKGGYNANEESEHHVSGKEEQDKEQLWAGLKGWTIIHDLPKNDEKPVWEWDLSHRRSLPKSHTWNENQSHEKQQNHENKQNKSNGVRKNNDDKIDKDEGQGVELRSKINKRKRVDEKEKQLAWQDDVKVNENQEKHANSGSRREEGKSKQKSVHDGHRWGGGRDRTRGEDDQDRQEKGEQRGGKDTESSDKNKRRDKHHRDNMDRRDRRRTHYNDHYTPIAYARRYYTI